MRNPKEFTAELKQKNLAGIGKRRREKRIASRHPATAPCVWKWQDVQDAIVEAGKVVGLEMVSRRVIRLCSPDKGATAHSFQFNIQMLQPGEHAVAHRHTQAGIRFVIKGKGASQTTIVTVAPAIGNAIYDAIGARVRSLPITPEKILAALDKIPGKEMKSSIA